MIPKRGKRRVINKMNTKKIMATFAILMVALSLVGYAYATWTKNLTINVKVNTGKVDIEWSYKGALTNGNKTIDSTQFVVASMHGQITGNELNVSITNAFPGLYGWVEFDVHNVGTIPVAVTDYTGPVIGGYDLCPWFHYDVSCSGDGTFAQIDAGQNVTIRWDFIFWQHAWNTPGGDVMPMDKTMTATWTMKFCNWNEQYQPNGPP
jgi:hypothetical protein